MAYQEFHHFTDEVFESRKIIDVDGSALYETELGSLLRKIITRNNTALLKQYIAAWNLTSSGIPVVDIQSHDPFYTAVANGSLDVLRVLLDIHRGNPNSVSIEQRGFSLLNVACEYAQLEAAKFLLDSGTVDDRHQVEWTPVISAAYSTGALGEVAGADRAQGQAVMNLLLDRGASARDAVPFPTDIDMTSEAQPIPQVEFTVLRLAIKGSSYEMVKRLLEHGADVQGRLGYYSNGLGFCDDGVNVRDVTALHLGSQCGNVDGARAPLDHGGDERGLKTPDLVYCRDSMVRLPLHWVAAGHDRVFERLLPESTLKNAITSTFGFLVSEDDKATTVKFINTQDKKGATPLHYAVSAHAHCGNRGSNHAYHIAQWLCSRGGDANIVDCRGQSVLHKLAYWSFDGEALDLSLIDLLLDHGAPINYTDESGETALHIMARNLRQAAATSMLLERGGRIDIDDGRQEWVTPEDRIRAQNEVVEALLEAGGSIIDQPIREGKTPR
ncbi:ankyrin repeat-containing domain protein [Aspergillus recurvatus]